MIALSQSPDSNTAGSRPPQVPPFGGVIYRYDVVASTQDVAREWVEQGAEPGTVVTAQAMTAGRGRRGRIWHTPPGANLSLTAICPAVATENIWQIPLITGIAVADAMGEVAPTLRVKLRFPNDVLLNGRKLGGVLVETARRKRAEDFVPLVGIGVNVLQAALPPEVTARAISLEDAGATVTIAEVENKILASLTHRWGEWQSKGTEEMLIAYHSLLDPTTRRSFVIEGQSVSCRVMRIFANGAVLIETDGGDQRAFHAAQVVLGDD